MILAERDFEFVRQFLLEQCKIALQPDQRPMVAARLADVARKEGIGELRELVDRLRDHPMSALRVHIIDALTTNETSFFRDVHPFETLKSVVLPELIVKRRPHRALRFWSAGCSTGQEPLSLSMLLLDSFPELARWDMRIHATDVSQSALAKARTGRYQAHEIKRGLPARLLQKYFVERGPEFQARPELLALIDWSVLNLSKPWPRLPPFDVVFLRNVLIYFPIETQEAVLGRMHRAMRRDGTLFLGTVESTLPLRSDFTPVVCGKTTLYRPTDPA